MYVCITIEIPFINKTMDFKVPKSMLVSTVIKTVCEIICTRYEGLDLDCEGAYLLSVKSHKRLNNDDTVKNNCVINNEKLILI